MSDDWSMPWAGRRTPAADIDPVTEFVDPQPTEVVGGRPVLDGGVDDSTDIVSTQAVDVATEVIHSRRQPRPGPRPDAQETQAIVPPAPIKPIWRGSADVRIPERDPYGSSSWTTWIAPRLRRRAWWLPIVLGLAGILILLTAAFVLVHAAASTDGTVPGSSSSAGH